MKNFSVKPGSRFPSGATLDANGVNFPVYSRHAAGAELLLFERVDSAGPFQVITLDAEARLLAYTLAAVDPDEDDLHIVCNMPEQTHNVTLPMLPDGNRYPAIDTGALAPKDIWSAGKQVIYKKQQ